MGEFKGTEFTADIKTIEDAQTMLDYTGCDYVMVGRSGLGNPWFIKNLVNYFCAANVLLYFQNSNSFI